MWFWGIPASPFGQACGLPLAWIGKTWRTGVFQSSSQHTLSIFEPKKQLEKLKRHVQASSFPMMSTCHGAHNLLDFSSLCCCHKIWGQVDLLAWINMPSRRDSHALLISRLWWIFASLLADWEDLVVMLTNTCYSQNINGCQDLQGSGSGRSGSWHGRPRSWFLHHGIWKCYPLLPLLVIPWWSQRVCTADLLNATTEAGLLSGRTSLVTWLSKSTGILRESPKELRKGRQDLSWSFATLHSHFKRDREYVSSSSGSELVISGQIQDECPRTLFRNLRKRCSQDKYNIGQQALGLSTANLKSASICVLFRDFSSHEIDWNWLRGPPSQVSSPKLRGSWFEYTKLAEVAKTLRSRVDETWWN
jgi:hypothetical protein